MDWKQHTPIAGARCSTATRQGGDIGVVYNSPDDTVITDARGEARMDTSAGDIVVMCRAPQFARAVKSTTAPAGQTTAVDVSMVHDGQSNGSIDAQFEFLGKHVVALTKGGQAERAGMQVGDEVVAVDGASVVELDTDSMSALITQRPGGTAVALGIVRGGQAKTISVIVRAIDR
jgi:C-terminal processing protease CtpA/Prc